MSATYTMKNTNSLMEEDKNLLKEMQKIFESCFPYYKKTTQQNPNIDNEFLSFAQGTYSSAFWNLLYVDDKLVGMMTFGLNKNKTSHIYNGCVLKKYQDEGYGTKLFSNTLRKMRLLKIKSSTIAFAKDHGVLKIRKKARQLGIKVIFDNIHSTWKVIF